MSEQLLHAIKHGNEHKDFRKKWNQNKISERENGFDAALSSSDGEGWLEVTRLTVAYDPNEADEEVRQEWVDYRLEQAEHRLCLTKGFSDSRYVLSCDAAVCAEPSENGETLYYFRAVYTHRSAGGITPIGKHFTADVKETTKLAADLCNALMELHRADILHKNITPSNIFKAEDGSYCLGRPGIEDDVEELKKSGFYPRGTYDVQSDIFMLGQCLSRIFQSENLSAKSTKKLQEIINKACDPEPYMRYQTAEEMLAALQKRGPSKKVVAYAGIGVTAAAVILGACLVVPSIVDRKLPQKSEVPQSQATETTAPEKQTETQAQTEETAAQTTAATESAEFKPSTATMGDPNDDGRVDVLDATVLLQMTAKGDFSGAEAHFDYNEDGEVDSRDVVKILAYSSYAATGGTDSFEQYLANKED